MNNQKFRIIINNIQKKHQYKYIKMLKQHLNRFKKIKNKQNQNLNQMKKIKKFIRW